MLISIIKLIVYVPTDIREGAGNVILDDSDSDDNNTNKNRENNNHKNNNTKHNNNKNANGALVEQGARKGSITAMNLDTVRGRRKGAPQHECCGKKGDPLRNCCAQ